MSDLEARVEAQVKTFSPEGQEAAKRMMDIYLANEDDKDRAAEKEFGKTLPPAVLLEIATLQMFTPSA
ncbi:hypothetical protein PRIPAC_75179 [Pristionchus pacificus]|uniref:Uncharacterized protein n=1 Tax=Pristionchus pacificus TaxID=54126 RepID=A0A2A6CFR4_PRIPA|nr:hypothetical protein PRIPAC_75179 [Pristionchus pacificus]|eukprot:PDM76979.1 hypothetical protein PRIPAC_42374 [Pristionchus pacificus]